jgi:hypothetical protein
MVITISRQEDDFLAGISSIDPREEHYYMSSKVFCDFCGKEIVPGEREEKEVAFDDEKDIAYGGTYVHLVAGKDEKIACERCNLVLGIIYARAAREYFDGKEMIAEDKKYENRIKI